MLMPCNTEDYIPDCGFLGEILLSVETSSSESAVLMPCNTGGLHT